MEETVYILLDMKAANTCAQQPEDLNKLTFQVAF